MQQRSARGVWVDSDILENFSRNGTNVIVARSYSHFCQLICVVLDKLILLAEL